MPGLLLVPRRTSAASCDGWWAAAGQGEASGEISEPRAESELSVKLPLYCSPKSQVFPAVIIEFI